MVIRMSNMLKDIVDNIQTQTKIPVYERSLINVLRAMTATSDFWQIVRLSKEPLNLVAIILTKLEEIGYVAKVGNELKFTNKGKKLVEELNIFYRDYTCPKCKGRGILYDLLDKDVINTFIQIQKNRPNAIRKYDQGYVLPEVTLSRVALMDQMGDLRGKEVIILGDDDLVSIAVGLTHWPKKIAVLEIDERLIKFIEKISNEYSLNIETYVRDLRKPLPNELFGKFDTFQTDPSETLPALRMFIGRGIATLKGPRCAGYFGLTRIEASLDKWGKLQKILLNEFGVVITDVIRDFSIYENWEYVEEMTGWKYAPVKVKPRENWYVSTMYRIETLPGFRGFNDPVISEDIYVDDELATV